MRLKNITALVLILQLTISPFIQPAQRVYAKGMSEETILAAVRIAATIHALAAIVDAAPVPA